MSRRCQCFLLASFIVFGGTLARAAAMKEIEDASAAARAAAAAAAKANSASAPQAAPAGAELVRLETALKRGEQINASLQSEVRALERERAQLVQIQSVLTSGLVGALVTAVVAIAGAIVTSRNSRPDRDLKRLAVLEKLRELDAAGALVPDDIRNTYARRQSLEASQDTPSK